MASNTTKARRVKPIRLSVTEERAIVDAARSVGVDKASTAIRVMALHGAANVMASVNGRETIARMSQEARLEAEADELASQCGGAS